MVICLLMALASVPRFGAEETLAGYAPADSSWVVAFERDARGPRNGLRTTVSFESGAWVARLSSEVGTAVGLSSAPLPSQDLSAFEEIHLWIRSDNSLTLQPYTQSSGWIFRDGGYPDLEVRGGEVVMLRIRGDSMADRTMVQSVGIQVRPRTSPYPSRLELLDVTAIRRQVPEASVDLIITPVEIPAAGFQYRIYSTSFQLSRTYDNPYDPAEIDAQAEFELPSGLRMAMPAFWFQDYSVAPGTANYEQYLPVGLPHWKVRFLPFEVGEHRVLLRVRDASGSTAEAGPYQFEVRSAPQSRGPVRRHPADPLILGFANGALYNPRGHNVAFEDGNPILNGTSYYDSLLSSLAAAGENWTRFWMTDFARTALEWGGSHFSGFYSGVGTYSQRAAWRVDSFLDLALARDIQVQLVLNDHGQFSSYVNARWDEGNPYGTAAGGPVPQASPELFFTDPASRGLFKRRLRYMIARWSAYPNLLCWELWNEVQFAGSPVHNFQTDASTRAAIVDWHREMSEYLKAQDPFGHLVTTSSDDPGYSGWSPIWNLASIDVVQSHHYAQPASGRDVRIAEYVDAAHLAYGKPVVVAEMGVKAAAEPECNFDPDSFLTNIAIPDQERTVANRDHMKAGTTLRNGVWAAAMRRSGAMNWWWGCYLSDDARRHRGAPDFPLNERVFQPVADFWGGEEIVAPMQKAALGIGNGLVGYGVQNESRAYVWLRDAREAYGSGFGTAAAENRRMDGASIFLTGLNAGSYVISPFVTSSESQTFPEFVVTAPAGRLEVPLPQITGDIALKIGDGTERAWGIVPRSARVWVTAEAGLSPETGYARLLLAAGSPTVSAGAILTLVQGENPTSDLMVPGVQKNTTFWSTAEIGAPSEVGLAVVNPGDAAASAQLELFDGEGRSFRARALELPPGGHIARFLYQMFPDVTGPFRGTFHLTSDVPIAALAMRGTRNERAEFILTTLPVHAESASSVAGPMVLPQVADGAGYQTELLLINPHDVRLEGRLSFRRSDGNPWALEMNGIVASVRDYSIPPRGITRAISKGTGANVEVGYCILEPGGDGTPAASGVIRLSQRGLQSESGVPFSRMSDSAATYWESSGETYTGVAFANGSPETRRIRLELFARLGIEKRLQAEFDLPPGHHTARLLTELFPDLPSGHGVMRVSSDGPVSFLAMRIRATTRGSRLTSSLLLGEPAGSGELIFPQIVFGGGYETRFVLLNPGGTTAEGRLVFYDSSGAHTRLLFRN